MPRAGTSSVMLGSPMNIVTDDLDVFRESCLKTLCTLFICQKPVIKCERIELVDNGVVSMLGVA